MLETRMSMEGDAVKKNSRFRSYAPLWKKSYKTLLSLEAQIKRPKGTPISLAK